MFSSIMTITAKKKIKRNDIAIFIFLVITFLIYLADALMSYISPIFVESIVENAFLVGLIFSFSSVIGLACDFLFPKIFGNKKHFFFLKITVFLAFAFPICYLVLPQHFLSLLMAMAIWGIYYELNSFSLFHFINDYVSFNDHDKIWGYFDSFKNLAYLLGPFFASLLIIGSYIQVFLLVFLLLFFVLMLILIFRFSFVKRTNSDIQVESIIQDQGIKRVSNFKIWKMLFSKVWTLVLLYFAITVIDSGFWTVGILFMNRFDRYPKN